MKIQMYYFTGTGFTERIAKGLRESFETLGQDAKLTYIPDIIAEDHRTENFNEDMLGICYPVHSFNAPEIVIRFAKRLPEGQGKKAFIVKTAGDKSAINAGSSLLLKRVLRKRGYLVEYEELVQMPTNFVVRYDDALILKIVTESEKLIGVIAEEIVKGRKKEYASSFDRKLFTSLLRVEWLGAHIIAKYYFKVDKTCNLCGICVRDCPTKNIHVKNGQIKFNLDCTFCMRCIYNCPQKAIHIRKPFSAIEVKDWFDIDELMKEKK